MFGKLVLDESVRGSLEDVSVGISRLSKEGSSHRWVWASSRLSPTEGQSTA